MSRLIRICAVHELKSGMRRVIDIDDDEEALVLNVEGTVYAISNVCPHQGAALERGSVEAGVLYCPLHRWGFALSSGASLDDVSLYASTYAVETHDGQLFLHLP